MPDKNEPYHIDVTPELIERYMQGLLDGKTRHALERQALDDPFLYEALEGYGMREPNQSAHLDDLHRRLEEKTKKVSGKMWWSRYRNAQMAAAAVLLVLIGIGIFFFIPADHTARNAIVLNDKNSYSKDSGDHSMEIPAADTPSRPDVAVNVSPQKPSPVLQKKRSSREKEKKTDVALSSHADTVDVIAYNPQQEREITASAAVLSSESSALREQEKTMMAARAMPMAARKVRSDTIALTGRVRDALTQKPLVGVTISVPGTEQGTVSDTSGAFRLYLPAQPETLQLAYIGYGTKNIMAKAGSRNLNISLYPDQRGLNEVMVVGYGKPREKEAYSATGAEPVGGWAAFRRYVKDSLHYPPEARKNQMEGMVKLSFLVLPDSSLRDIRLIESPGYGCGEEAIRLLKQGPKWYPAAPADTGKATIKIRFDLKRIQQ